MLVDALCLGFLKCWVMCLCTLIYLLAASFSLMGCNFDYFLELVFRYDGGFFYICVVVCWCYFCFVCLLVALLWLLIICCGCRYCASAWCACLFVVLFSWFMLCCLLFSFGWVLGLLMVGLVVVFVFLLFGFVELFNLLYCVCSVLILVVFVFLLDLYIYY